MKTEIHERDFVKSVGALLLLGVLFLIFPLSAPAEFYKYVDESGTTVYTDDLSQVPPEMREDVPQYSEVKSPPAAESPAKSEAADEGEGGDQLSKTREDLVQRDKELKAEYNRLKNRKEALQKEEETLETYEQKKAYYDKVQQLNEEIKAYKERLAAFEKAVATFNSNLNKEVEKAEN